MSPNDREANRLGWALVAGDILVPARAESETVIGA